MKIGIVGIIFWMALAIASQADEKHLLILPAGSVAMGYTVSKPPQHVTIHLDGWLVCNGATVSRSTYKELFVAEGDVGKTGDGKTTFELPDMPLKLENGKPIKGWAISPTTTNGNFAAQLSEFDFTSY